MSALMYFLIFGCALVMYDTFCQRMILTKISLTMLRGEDWFTLSRPFGAIWIWHKYKDHANK